MKITNNKVATFHYELFDDDGKLLESSGDKDPVSYLHGHNNIVHGLEKELEGKQKGDTVEVTLDPIDGYGVFNEELVQRVPSKYLDVPRDKLKAGMVANLNTSKGPRPVRVIKAGKFNATVDANHPYAGLEITFRVTIQAVRDASDEEIAHHHAHGIGGHQH